MTRPDSHVCSNHLAFRAWIAPPGYGQSWRCTVCEEPFWSPGDAASAVPTDVLGRPPELTVEEVI